MDITTATYLVITHNLHITPREYMIKVNSAPYSDPVFDQLNALDPAVSAEEYRRRGNPRAEEKAQLLYEAAQYEEQRVRDHLRSHGSASTNTCSISLDALNRLVERGEVVLNRHGRYVLKGARR